MHANFLNGSFHLHEWFGLNAPGDARATPIRIKLQLHTIAHEHFNSMQTHLSCEVREYSLTGCEIDAKERIRERLVDHSFYDL